MEFYFDVDPEKGNIKAHKLRSIYTGGSAVVPEFNSNVTDIIDHYKALFPEESQKSSKFDEEIRKFYVDHMRKVEKMDEETYRSQKSYGLCIFITVILLVGAGIYFSIVQLLNAIKLGQGLLPNTTLELQTGSIMISTSMIGAFVLIVSLAFFFLFLKYVYGPNNVRNDFFKEIPHVKNLMDRKD